VHHDLDRNDDGFTLIELLIVVVILGVLSTVTVFAMRGITGQAGDNACTAELRNLATAQEEHWVLHGTYAVEADLVSNDVITRDSSLYDITVADADTYTITPAPDSACTNSTTGGSSAGGTTGSSGGGGTTVGPDRSTYTISLNDLQTAGGSATDYAGFSSIEYNSSGGADEILVFGRSEGQLDFVDMVNAAPSTSRRIAFVHLDEFADGSEIVAAMSAARNNGFSTFAFYPGDDDGSTQAFVAAQIGNGPNSGNEELVVLSVFGGPNQTLLELVNSIG